MTIKKQKNFYHGIENANIQNQHKILHHSFHIVEPSWQPFFTSISLILLVLGIVGLFHFKTNLIFQLYMISVLLLVIFSLGNWWSEIVVESNYYNFFHTNAVRQGLRIGMVLFIVSEVMFFFSFFWAFFHASLSPAISIGGVWSPMGIEPFVWYEIPLLNTIILLTSGAYVTWAHRGFLIPLEKTKDVIKIKNFLNIYSFIAKISKDGNTTKSYLIVIRGLIGAILLGLFFTSVQLYEYVNAPFSINDSIYGSTFFLLTGFHGLHVIIGTIFLIVAFLRLRAGHYERPHGNLNFEFAAWYWHFVDVIWLFLFIIIYCWGS